MTIASANKQAALNLRLFEAIKDGNLEEMQSALSDGADVNARDNDDLKATPLHRACYEYDVDAVKILLEAGANLNALDASGHTPLVWAVQEEDEITIIKLLLAADTQHSIKNNDLHEAIEMAEAWDHEVISEYLSHIQGGLQRPKPQDVGLDIEKRQASLAKLAAEEPAVPSASTDPNAAVHTSGLTSSSGISTT